MAITAISTMTKPERFVNYDYTQGGVPVLLPGHVVIRGGNATPDRDGNAYHGVATTLTEEQYNFVKENETFKKRINDGYIRVEVTNKKISREKTDVLAAALESRDGRAPVTENDIDGIVNARNTTKKVVVKELKDE